MPEVARVTANIYTLEMREKSPIPSAPILLETYALKITDMLLIKMVVPPRISAFMTKRFNLFIGYPDSAGCRL